METISISKLKAHLSAELKKVQRGVKIMILDHNRPVAELVPTDRDELFVREASTAYTCPKLEPLTETDPLLLLAEERDDRWPDNQGQE